MKAQPRPARPVAPGRIIKRELEARGWTQKDLADIMQRPEKTISEIVRGKKQITPETARQLAQAFGTSPDLWLNLEMNYQLHLAQSEKKEGEIARRSRLYSWLPIAELIKRRWIRRADTVEELEREVWAFLEIETLDALPDVAANFRHSAKRGPELGAEFAWLKRVEFLTRNQPVAEFDRENLKRNIESILAYAADEEDVAQVPPALIGMGVHFLLVPHLPGTYLDGAALYVDGRPVVALTLRYDRIDVFWFTLMHELAHIVLGHTETVLDRLYHDDRDDGHHGKDNHTHEEREDSKDKREHDADHLAQEWLVDSMALDTFIALVEPYFSRNQIERFARQQGRHPGIILGRLQHDKVVEYKHLRSLLVKVSPYLEAWVDVPEPALASA